MSAWKCGQELFWCILLQFLDSYLCLCKKWRNYVQNEQPDLFFCCNYKYFPKLLAPKCVFFKYPQLYFANMFNSCAKLLGGKEVFKTLKILAAFLRWELKTNRIPEISAGRNVCAPCCFPSWGVFSRPQRCMEVLPEGLLHIKATCLCFSFL